MTAPASGPARTEPPRANVTVVGVVGGEVFGTEALEAIRVAQVLIASPRHHDRVDSPARRVELTADLAALDAEITRAGRDGERVCVLASGDPGYFGIVRHLTDSNDTMNLRVLPAPSSVSLAFARAGLSWDDAFVVSAHGRPLAPVLEAVRRHPKVAVLTGPAAPPAALGAALLDSGMTSLEVVVASRLGEADETLTRTDPAGLAAGDAPAMSVVICLGDGTRGGDGAPVLRFGRGTDEFAHRGGMITKPEVRAIALARLELAWGTTLWDLGAGSGSVGIEAAGLAADLRVVAVDVDPGAVSVIRSNSLAHGVSDRVRVVEGRMPSVLDDLPAPDRVFVGGGGLDVIDAAWERLGPGGVLVATFVSIERALAARERLDDMATIRVERASPIGGVGTRFVPENPVHICWGRR